MMMMLKKQATVPLCLAAWTPPSPTVAQGLLSQVRLLTHTSVCVCGCLCANSGAWPSQSGQTLDSYFSLCVCVYVCANSSLRPSQSGQTLDSLFSVPCVAHQCMADRCP